MLTPIAESPEETRPRTARSWSSRLDPRRVRWDLVTWLLVATTAVGSILRLAGLSWGLPLTLHADEWVVVDGAIDMASRNSFEPGYFFRPDHLEMQLSYIAYQAYSHLVHGVSPEVQFAQDEATFYLISRSITALFGIGMIVLAALIGRRFSRVVGLLSAMAVAFFPPFVENSHFATPDVPLTFACMVVILGCIRYLESRGWPDLLLACLGVALAFTIKYPGAASALMIALVVVVTAVIDRRWSRVITHGAGAIAAVVLMIFLVSPVLFTNIDAVLEQVRGQNSTGHLGADGLGWSGNLVFYAQDFASEAGVLVVVLAAAGAAWAVRDRMLAALPLMTGAILWVVLSSLELHWDRWGLPMYLTPLLLAPIGLTRSWAALRERFPTARLVPVGAAVVSGLALLNLVVASTATTARFLATDTRTESLDFSTDNGFSMDNSIVEGYTPLSPGVPRLFFDKFSVADGEIRVAETGDGATAPTVVMSSSGMSARFQAEAKYVDQQTVYRLLDEQFPVLQRWTSTPEPEATALEPLSIVRHVDYLGSMLRGGLVGPDITIYSVPDDRR